MNRVTQIFLSACLACFVASMFVCPVFADAGSAQTAISVAQQTLKNCYVAVNQAESAGADVDSLVVTLNSAAGSLSKAELAYASGNYDAAYNYASQIQSKVGGVISQANTLKADATAEGNHVFLFNVLYLGAGLGVLFVGVGAWFVLGKRQRRIVDVSLSV